MSPDDDDFMGRIREAAHDLASGSGQRLIKQWQDLKISPLIACIALIRMAYTLAPKSVIQASDGPEQFAQLCKQVAEKDGALGGSPLGDS